MTSTAAAADSIPGEVMEELSTAHDAALRAAQEEMASQHLVLEEALSVARAALATLAGENDGLKVALTESDGISASLQDALKQVHTYNIPLQL